MRRWRYPQLWRGCVGAWCPAVQRFPATQLSDYSGNNNHGALTNMDVATDWVPMGGVTTLDFDGANDNVTTGVLPCFDLGPLSVSWWVYLRTATNSDQFFQTNAASGSSAIETNAAAFTRVRFIRRWGTTNISAAFNGAYVLNQWSHIVMTWNGGSDGSTAIKCFANGKELSQQASTVGGTYVAPSAGNVFQFGQASSLAPDGGMNDVRVYDRVLTGAEAALLARRVGIAYDLEPRRTRTAAAAAGGFKAAWIASRSSHIIGGGSR